MLSLEKVMEIRRLLQADQLSQRKIAAKLRVSRGIVQAIASGRRGIHGRETSVNDSFDNQDTLPQRCRGCGARVYMPCLLCQARQYHLRQEQDEIQHSNHPTSSQNRVA